MEDKSINILNGFNQLEWERWIISLLDNQVLIPPVSGANLSKDEVLQLVYRSLNQESKDRFVESIVSIIQKEPKNNDSSEHLFIMLNILNFVKPYSFQIVVRNWVLNDLFVGITYRNLNLHTYLIDIYSNLIYSNYGNPQTENSELTRYLMLLPERIQDVRFFYIAVRVFSKINPTATFPFIETVLPLINNSNSSDFLVAAIIESCIKYGSRDLYFWFKENLYDIDKKVDEGKPLRLACKYPIQADLVYNSLAYKFKDWSEFIKKDNYAILLFGLIGASIRPFSAEELVIITNTLNNGLIYNDVAELKFVLSTIFSESILHFNEWVDETKISNAAFQKTDPWGIKFPLEYPKGDNYELVTIWESALLSNYTGQIVPLEISLKNKMIIDMLCNIGGYFIKVEPEIPFSLS